LPDFFDTIYQNGEIYTKLPLNYPLAIKIPNGSKMFQMNKKNVPTFSIPKPNKTYPNWDFWFENKPSGNPGDEVKKS
jgi:hypothetical protein